tara:strand:- start:1574 stop:1921 length:348 start_codon:yes stop_codon:yes gene_type:complete
MKDLAPDIYRQRLVMEFILNNKIESHKLVEYSEKLTEKLGMTLVSSPILTYAPDYGWSVYVHWKESGMHIYTWDKRDPVFISVDLYTCKKFEINDALNYTKDFFINNLVELVWKE